MSTAKTVYDQNELPYSPRKQGAGLATLDNVMETQAYLWTDEANGGAEDNRPKIELGYDKNCKGVDDAKSTFENLTFYVTNFGLAVFMEIGNFVAVVIEKRSAFPVAVKAHKRNG
mgnify:CR=1 FL=1